MHHNGKQNCPSPSPCHKEQPLPCRFPLVEKQTLVEWQRSCAMAERVDRSAQFAHACAKDLPQRSRVQLIHSRIHCRNHSLSLIGLESLNCTCTYTSCRHNTWHYCRCKCLQARSLVEILDCLDDCTIHHHTYNSPCGQGSCHRCSPKQCLAIHVAIESGAISYQEWRPKKRSWDHHVHVWLQSFQVGWCVPKCHPKVQHAHRAQTILDCTHHWSNWWSSGLQRALDSIQHQFEAYWTNQQVPLDQHLLQVHGRWELLWPGIPLVAMSKSPHVWSVMTPLV